ncbi:MAG: hypothetical protein EON59_14115 [Alphaproteobacteria bacterium]|nr:MAG: hypothetical protein EON59_14115 [Alphaproteobacteria bacterium]
MPFVTFTRPDDTEVAVNTAEVLKVAPVPTSGPTMGPLLDGTRIYFISKEHQDVKELLEEVTRRLNSA